MKYLVFILTSLMTLNSGESQDKSPILIMDQVDQMSQLEKEGLTFSQIVSGKPRTTNTNLYKNKAYKSFANVINADLDKIKSGDKYLSVTMSKKHRLFDKRWWSSKRSFYELVGLVTRLDRAPFSNDPRYKCGEVRLLYRMAYNKTHMKENIYSRLPVTINMVFWLVDKDGSSNNCTEIAKSWRGSPLEVVKNNMFLFKMKNLKSLEVNLQAVRWPSTVRGDFGGYAEYLLRVFSYDQSKKVFTPALMENMVDVAKVKSSPKLKKELKDFLTNPENLKKFDEGIGVIPEKFVTKKAISVAFHGIARLANRPFDQIYKESDFEKVNFKENTFVKTPGAYLRRLNDMTCIGCHQSRSVAGFHFVGVDRKNTFSANAVKMARSGHLQLDLLRRQKYFASLLANKKPDEKRGFSERLETERGGYGAHCTLGKDPSFSKWTCESGLKCQSIDTAINNNIIGVCLPEVNKFAGDPCDVGRVSQNANGRKDRVIKKVARACRSDQYCFKARDGFPGGLCHNYCEKIGKGEACGLIAFNGFNSCLFQNKPFTKCLTDFTGDISLKACDNNTPCRDDFVCARSKNNTGVCIPPYFLFQLRVDGHPRPT